MDADGQDDDCDDSAIERRLEQLLLRIDADDVTEEQLNWTKIGTCLHFKLAPVLRKYIQPVIINLYETLKSSSGIENQTKDNFLVEYPTRMGESCNQMQNSYKLHYRNINNNNFNFAQRKERYVYSVTDAVELSKLFLPKPKETNYKDFDRISLSSVLNLIINISDFRHPLQLDAMKVRDKIRNRWAHPEEYTWGGEQLSKFFAEIQQCIGSLQLLEEEHSKILHQVLCLRYCDTRNTLKKDIRNLIQDVIYTRINSGDLQRCHECLRRDIVAPNQPDNNTSDINDTSPEIIKKQWVCVIKLYSWLKDEMKKPHAVCVASQLLNPDDAEVISNSMSRLMAVDRLLKYVLCHENVYLCEFLKISDLHLKNTLTAKMQVVRPSKEEIEDCERRNSHQINESNVFPLAETDKTSLLCKINTMKTIDFLNNGFLEKFFFSLAEHDRVCEYLHRSEFSNGASCLISIMERRSCEVMNLLCYLLEQRKETAYIVELLRLRENYCMIKDVATTETYNAEVGICTVLRQRDKIDVNPLQFDVTSSELGSIVFRLCPRSTHSWGDLKRLCLSGDIINVLNHTFLDKEILKWLYVDEPRLLLSIYSEESLSRMDEAQRVAILKLNFISEESDSDESACGGEENPLQSNYDILCEELDISDDLIKILKIMELVSSDISLKLEQTNSRASEIRCLLKNISLPEEGYKVIKEYLKYSNSYAYQALIQRENTSCQRNLIYKCEACLKCRVDSGTQTSAKDIDTDDPHEKTPIYKQWKITWSKYFFEQHEHVEEQNKLVDKATSTGDDLWLAKISEDSGLKSVYTPQISEERTSYGESANIDVDDKQDLAHVISEEETERKSQLLAGLKTCTPDIDIPFQTPAQEEELKQTRIGRADSVGSMSVYGASDELTRNPFCENCFKNGTMRSVAGYCPKCVELYCKSCLAFHRHMSVSAHHRILLGSDMPACQADKPVKYQVCDKHDGEDKDRYCFNHGIIICWICFIREHKQCQVKTVSDACKSIDMSNEKACFSAYVGLFLKDVKETSRLIKSNKTRLEKKRQIILTEGRNQINELKEKVEQSYQVFSRKVTSLFKDRTATLSARQSALDEIVTKITAVLQSAQQSGTKEQNDQNDFLQLHYSAEKLRFCEEKIKLLNLKHVDINCTLNIHIQPLVSTKIKLYELSLQTETFKYSTKLPSIYYSYTGSSQDPQKTIPGSGAIGEHLVQAVKLTPLDKINVKTPDDAEDCLITGVDITADGNMLLVDISNCKVKLLSPDGTLLSSLKPAEIPVYVAVINKSEAAISMLNEQIGIIDIADSGHISLKHIITTEQYVWAITAYKNNLIVTSETFAGGPFSVQMIDMGGEVLWTTTTDFDGENLLGNAWFLTTCSGDDGDTVIVTDCVKQTITVLDAGTGNVVKICDVEGKEPYGVTVDDKGNVFVCYESEEITAWSRDMQEETRLTTESKYLMCPWAMAYDSRRSVLVLSSNAVHTDHRNFVYRFKIVYLKLHNVSR